MNNRILHIAPVDIAYSYKLRLDIGRGHFGPVTYYMNDKGLELASESICGVVIHDTPRSWSNAARQNYVRC